MEGDAQVSREFLSKMVVVLLERTEPASRNAKPLCIAVWERGYCERGISRGCMYGSADVLKMIMALTQR